jgi:TIR domain-containing protein
MRRASVANVKIFLSYATADRAFPEELRDALTEEGHDVWTDRNMLPGDNWAKEIDVAISRADVVVALISPEAAKSEWVRNEWQYALGQQKFENRLIPVRIKRTTAEPWIFERLQVVQASSAKQVATEVSGRLRSLRRTRASSA